MMCMDGIMRIDDEDRGGFFNLLFVLFYKVFNIYIFI